MAHGTDPHASPGTHAAPPESRALATVAFLLTIAFTALLLWVLVAPR